MDLQMMLLTQMAFFFWGGGRAPHRARRQGGGGGVSGPGFVWRGADVLTAALALAVTYQHPVPLLHPKGP